MRQGAGFPQNNVIGLRNHNRPRCQGVKRLSYAHTLSSIGTGDIPVTHPRTEPYSRRHLPADIGSAYSILDGMTGGRSATLSMLSGRRWPGAELAGPELSLAPVRPLRIAQSGVAAVDAVAEVLPSIGEFTVERLASGALRIGGAIFTAAALLQELSYISTRAQILDAMSRFGLDQNQAADVMAARAYVCHHPYLSVGCIPETAKLWTGARSHR